MGLEKKQIEKYLNGTATEQEARNVLAWFKSREGQEYLEGRFSEDVQNIESLEELLEVPPDSSHTFKHIRSHIVKSRQPVKLIRKPHRSSVWAVAAGISFLIAAISIMEIFHGTDTPQLEEPAMTVYSTDAEQKLLTLSDGSELRLNQNSSIEMPENFDLHDRTVKLDGEAFFKVVHNPERPFKVNTGSAEIRVLGTAFGVKTNSPKNDIYVTVSEGSVSLASSLSMADQADRDEEILEKGMIGIYNTGTNEITTETIDINNYLSWMHGRMIFDQTPFYQVTRQLERIYDIECEIKDDALLDLKLTTNFSEISLQNVLNVIAEGLEIEYEQEEDVVRWALRDH